LGIANIPFRLFKKTPVKLNGVNRNNNCSENHRDYVNTLCRQNVEYLSVKLEGAQIKHFSDQASICEVNYPFN
jgi:hypothetical protein